MPSDMHGAKRGKRPMYYVASAFYTPSAVRGIRFDDSRAFSIQWPLVATLVSEQARSLAARRAAGVVKKARDRIGI
jgi:dTDP-4-dehydrorhamnose 3,5-epimerase-like enzyme